MQTYPTGENVQLIQALRELESLYAQLTKLGGSAEGDQTIVPKDRVPEVDLEYVCRLRGFQELFQATPRAGPIGLSKDAS